MLNLDLLFAAFPVLLLVVAGLGACLLHSPFAAADRNPQSAH